MYIFVSKISLKCSKNKVKAEDTEKKSKNVII